MAKTTTSKAPAAVAAPAAPSRLTKSAQIKAISETTGQPRAAVKEILDAHVALAASELRAGREFVVSGIARLKVVEKPEVPAGLRTDPFSKETPKAQKMYPAKPASKKVKARASKSLLEG